jgi:predicted amidohydrolase YtcJ
MFERASDLFYQQEGKQSKEKELRAAFDHLLSYGITSVRSFGSLDVFIELGRMAQSQKGIPLRVCGCIPYQDISWVKDLRLQTNLGSEFFWVGQIKMFADGSLGSSTAFVSRPYPDGTTGLEVMNVKEMADIAKTAHELKLGVAIHTIGDQSAANVARVMKNTNYMDTIEHLQCASLETIKEISKCETPVIVNPSHIPMDVEAIFSQWKEISYMAYPMASLIAAGIPVGFGSDAPVATVNPFYAIACATSRKGQSTKQINPREAISFSTAMGIITEKSAKIIGGPKRGRIDNGWLADLAIAEDFRGLDPWDCAWTKIKATYVGGVSAWQAQH